MRTLMVAAVLAATLPAYAQTHCYGTGSFRSCYDAQSGNTYNTIRSGNYSMTDGHNPSTGSRWTQDSITSGNITNHWGRAADGNTWNGTTIRSGNIIMDSGTDSRGRTYNRTCVQTAYGCF